MRDGVSGFAFDDAVFEFVSGFNVMLAFVSADVFEFVSETATSSVGDGIGVAATVASGEGDGDATAAPE